MTDPGYRLFGDRSAYAIEARLIDDPAPEGAAAADVWSYGDIRIFVRKRCLTRHVTPHGFREGICWYLAPLLRWLSAAWLPLLHEQRTPSLVGSNEHLILRFEQGERLLLDDESPQGSRRRADMQAWRRRHSLWTGAAGGVFPNVWFRRQSDLCEISYDPGTTIGAPRSFEFQFSRGAVLLDVAAVAEALSGFLHWGVRIGQNHGADVVLPSKTDAWSAERWLLGDGLTHVLMRAEIGPPRLEYDTICVSSPEVAMFGTLRPELSRGDARVLLDRLHEARSPAPEPAELQALVTDLPLPTRDTAWEQGYDLALRTLDVAVGDRSATDGFVDVEAILRKVGVAVHDLDIDDMNLRGVAIAGEGFRPTILVNGRAHWNRSAPGRRFTLAHELGHLLVDRGRARRVTHSSTPWAPEAIERRANAFAAMFLMPYHAIDAVVASVGPIVDAHGLKRAARKLRCGRIAVLEHLKNVGRIGADAYFRIRAELGIA